MAASLRSLAVAAIESQRLDVARPLWQQLCEHEPADTDNWLVLSAIDDKLGFLPAALDHLQYARHLSPSDPDVWHQSAKVKWRMRDFDGAFSDIARALSLDFTDRQLRALFASWLMECHRFAESLVHYWFMHLSAGALGPEAVKAMACSLCAGDLDAFDQWSRRYSTQPGDDLAPAIADELRYLLRPCEPFSTDATTRDEPAECAALIARVGDLLNRNHEGFDWHQYFDRRAHVADYSAGDDSSRVMRALADRVRRAVTAGNGAPPQIVDLGCGTGRLADELAAHGLDAVVSGIDHSPECIRVANSKNRYDNLVAADIVGGVSLNLVSTADVVVLADVLEYCGDFSNVLWSIVAAIPDYCGLYITWEGRPGGPANLHDCIKRTGRQAGRRVTTLRIPGRKAVALERRGDRTAGTKTARVDTEPDRESIANRLIEAARLHDNGRYEESGEKSKEVLEVFPHSSQALFHLGVRAQDRKNFDEALHYFRRALSVHRGYASAWFHIGAVHQQRGAGARLAAHAYTRCLKYAPNHPAALTNLARLHAGRRDDEAAWLAIKSLLAQHPLESRYPESLRALLKQHGNEKLLARLDEYLSGFEWLAASLGQAIEKKLFQRARGFIDRLQENGFDNEQLLLRRAQLGEKSGDLNLAAAHGAELIRGQRDNPVYWQFLASVTAARGSLRDAFRLWNTTAAKVEPDSPMLQNRLFFSNYCEFLSARQIGNLHLDWGRKLPTSPDAGAGPGRRPGPRKVLRIGYVSGDFRMHSVAIFLYNILKYRNRRDFQVYCYSTVPSDDPMSTKLRLFSNCWREIGKMDDASAARLIERDEIDILVDLAGHTAWNRLPLFRRRPAPVQCTYLGYANTTGLTEMDYRITDRYSDPVGMTEHLHSEELIRLPNGFLSYSRHLASTPVTLEDLEDAVRYTFVCCNNVYKINDAVVRVWSRILGRLPQARVLIKAHNLNNPEILSVYRAKFRKHGVAEDQVHLMNTLDVGEHQNLYNRADIALDPFPYNGTTTTCDALWMGVPVLTLAGDRHAGRVGVSILNQVGLRDWIAADEDDYVDKAVRFARDPAGLASLKLEMRQRLRNSPLMKPGVVTRDLEDAYRDMWRRRL